MKSFTHNQSNIQSLRSDKRLDVLVKKEMTEHQHLISGHHKEMQALRDSLNLSMERFESLYGHREKELKDFKEYITSHICLIKEKMIANDVLVAEQKKTIASLYQQLNEFHETYASKRSAEKLKSDFDLAIKSNTMSHLNAFQEFQREFNVIINNIKEEVIKLKCDMQLMHCELNKEIESNFSILRIDKEGVLKEVRVYEKTIFIIEKKIENIYTLIERLNKRGEVCHKPE